MVFGRRNRLRTIWSGLESTTGSDRASAPGPTPPRARAPSSSLIGCAPDDAERGAGAIVLADWDPSPASPLAAGADHLNIEIADLLAQGVAVDAEKIGGPDLVAARRGKRRRQQRIFDLA